MIAALYVEKGGSYFGLQGVDPWDEERDARRYPGPHPVVVHSPCQRWGKMYFGQPLTVKRTGERKIKGDDQGCFKCGLFDVRRWGGVMEHPWGSHAWPYFGLNTPPREGGWIAADFHGGWTCCVEQGRYGHYARKPTLLIVYGVSVDQLPQLDWGVGEPRLDPQVVDRMGLARAKRLGEVGARGGGDRQFRAHRHTRAISGSSSEHREPRRPAKARRMTGTLVIIESPYAGEVERNVEYARAAMRDSLQRGEHPIASHLLYTQPGILDDDIPEERMRGIAAGLAWRRVADRAVFYVDRGWSSGMLAARDTYQHENIPFEERTLEGWS